MARRKATPQETKSADVFDEQIALREAEAKERAEAEAHREVANGFTHAQEHTNGHQEPKKEWKSRFDPWRDNVAGVRMEEDRKNRLTTILFRENAPQEAQQRLEEHGYVKESDHAFSKPIEYLRRREHREEAENLVLEVDNIVRKGKGLEPKQSYYISRS